MLASRRFCSLNNSTINSSGGGIAQIAARTRRANISAFSPSAIVFAPLTIIGRNNNSNNSNNSMMMNRVASSRCFSITSTTGTSTTAFPQSPSSSRSSVQCGIPRLFWTSTSASASAFSLMRLTPSITSSSSSVKSTTTTFQTRNYVKANNKARKKQAAALMKAQERARKFPTKKVIPPNEGEDLFADLYPQNWRQTSTPQRPDSERERKSQFAPRRDLRSDQASEEPDEEEEGGGGGGGRMSDRAEKFGKDRLRSQYPSYHRGRGRGGGRGGGGVSDFSSDSGGRGYRGGPRGAASSAASARERESDMTESDATASASASAVVARVPAAFDESEETDDIDLDDIDMVDVINREFGIPRPDSNDPKDEAKVFAEDAMDTDELINQLGSDDIRVLLPHFLEVVDGKIDLSSVLGPEGELKEEDTVHDLARTQKKPLEFKPYIPARQKQQEKEATGEAPSEFVAQAEEFEEEKEQVELTDDETEKPLGKALRSIEERFHQLRRQEVDQTLQMFGPEFVPEPDPRVEYLRKIGVPEKDIPRLGDLRSDIRDIYIAKKEAKLNADDLDDLDALERGEITVEDLLATGRNDLLYSTVIRPSLGKQPNIIPENPQHKTQSTTVAATAAAAIVSTDVPPTATTAADQNQPQQQQQDLPQDSSPPSDNSPTNPADQTTTPDNISSIKNLSPLLLALDENDFDIVEDGEFKLAPLNPVTGTANSFTIEGDAIEGYPPIGDLNDDDPEFDPALEYANNPYIERFNAIAKQVTEVEYNDFPIVGERNEFVDLYAFCDDDPRHITEEDLGKMYVISTDNFKKHFPEGAPPSLDRAFWNLHHRAIMVRSQALRVIDFMGTSFLQRMNAAAKSTEPASEFEKEVLVRGFIFDGERGSGKSSELFHVVHWARTNNWIVLYVPNGYEWLHGITFIEPSPLLKGYFDIPEMTLDFLQKFRDANATILQELPLSQKYDLFVPAESSPPTTLADLCTWGLADMWHATIATKFLLDELAKIQNRPMIFAIDGYNYFNTFSSFSFGNPDDIGIVKAKKVHAKEMTFIRGIHNILKRGDPNKLFVCATSYKQENVLGKQGAKGFRWRPTPENCPLVPVQTPSYSREELLNILSYYCSVYFLFGVPIDKMLDELMFMTGGNPEKIWTQMCMF